MKFFLVFAVFGLLIFVSMAVRGAFQDRWMLAVASLFGGFFWVIGVAFTYKTWRYLKNES